MIKFLYKSHTGLCFTNIYSQLNFRNLGSRDVYSHLFIVLFQIFQIIALDTFNIDNLV